MRKWVDGFGMTDEHPALTEALRALSLPRRKPSADDAVPATRGFPVTRAQREALRLGRSRWLR